MGIEMNGFPTEGTPTDPADHSATSMPKATYHYDGAEIPPATAGFQSTIGVGDYAMPRAGKTSDYKVKGKDK